MKPWRCRTEHAARIALRTQADSGIDQSGVALTADALGGSYFVENLTLKMKHGAFDYFLGARCDGPKCSPPI